MSTVQAIEGAIQRLPDSEVLAPVDRLRERYEGAWGWQIAADAAAGRLDFLVAEAQDEIQQAKTKPLDVFLGEHYVLASLLGFAWDCPGGGSQELLIVGARSESTIASLQVSRKTLIDSCGDWSPRIGDRNGRVWHELTPDRHRSPGAGGGSDPRPTDIPKKLRPQAVAEDAAPAPREGELVARS